MSLSFIWSTMVQVLCFLVDFLSGWSTYCWKEGIEVASYYSIIISLFRSISICLMYLGALILCVFIFMIVLSSTMNWPLSHYMMTSLSLITIFFWLRVYLVSHKYSYPIFILISTCMKHIFASLHFEPLKAEVILL